MALNTFKFNYLTPLHFKGLKQLAQQQRTAEYVNTARHAKLASVCKRNQSQTVYDDGDGNG